MIPALETGLLARWCVGGGDRRPVNVPQDGLQRRCLRPLP